LLNGPKLPHYCARIVDQIQASNFARIEFLVFRQRSRVAAPAHVNGWLLRRIGLRLLDPGLRKRLLYELYLRFDDRKKSADHPRNVVDCASRLTGIESIEVEPIGQRFVQRFPVEAVEEIRSKKLDVLIRFGFNILKGDILSAARCGIWSYHHGDNEFYRGGPPHFWELYERNPISGVVLQVLTDELDAGLILRKCLFTTETTTSVAQNNFGSYWGAADLVIQKLNELHRFGWDHVQQHAVPPITYKGKRALYRTPSNREMAWWLASVWVKKAALRPFRKGEVQHWRIAIRLNAPPLFSRPFDGSLQGFRWIESPKGHFWADPFVLEQQGRKWIFFEDYTYARKRGSIACSEIGSDGSLISPTACVEDPQNHYSYPYVFRDGEELYMLPEARGVGSVDLYRCEEFPHKWSRHTTLLRGKFVDPTIWQHEGLWWLMASSADPDARAASLLLFYAEALGGQWTLHPTNPVSTDARYNRGAGKTVWSEGRLIRPSQSSCPIYGYSFTFNEVTSLSTTEYKERPLQEFRPESLNLEAMHTYNWIPGLEVIDGARNMPLAKV
jgi:hypothetical protein